VSRVPGTLALACALATHAPAQDQPAWRYVTDRPITSFGVLPVGGLLVTTDRSVSLLDLASGEARWTLQGGGGVSYELLPLEGRELGLLNARDSFTVLDVRTGAARWTSSALPLRRMVRHWLLTEPDRLLVIGESPDRRGRLLAVIPETGTVEWVRDDLLDPNVTLTLYPVRDTDSTVIVGFFRRGLLRLHVRTGASVWSSAALPRDQAPGRVTVVDSVVVVPYGERLLALGQADGRVLWNRTQRFPFSPAQLQMTPHGLLVRGAVSRGTRPCGENEDETCSFTEGMAFLDLIETQTGRSAWSRPLRDDLDPATPFVMIGDTAYLVSNGWLRAVSLPYRRMAAVAAVRFRGGEEPRWIEMRSDGFLVGASQNLLLMGRDGRVKYHRYYRAPHLVSTLEALAVVAAEAAFTHDLTGIIDSALSMRSRATAAGPHDFYMFTNQSDSGGREGFSFVRLDTRDGRELGRVWVDQRRPQFVLDPESSTLIVRRGQREVVALRF
jgi:hypothetical protein